MTDEEIAAERWACREWIRRQSRWQSDSEIWLARAAIARAEQADLRADNERLRERVRELAKTLLREFLDGMVGDVWQRVNALPENDKAPVLMLAEEAGVWFDDDGNEVPLAEWRKRMGGVG